MRSILSSRLPAFILPLAIAVLVSGLPQTVRAQHPILPSTRAGQLVGEWMKLCRAASLDQITQWLTANLSDAGAKRISVKHRARDDFELCASNGGFRAMKVNNTEPNTISLVLVGLKSDIWLEKRLEVNDAGQLDRASLSPTAPLEETLPKILSDAAIASAVNATVGKLSRAGLFSGIVNVARGTQTIASASGGYADLAKKTPITGSTQFTLGSMGKMFTAASIGQLVDQAKMSFADTVGHFFPDYPNQTVRDQVTVAMLLSHTAGMGDFLNKRTPEMMKGGVQRADEFMPLYDRDEPQFAPGTGWAYSNAGLALAGAIVEKVSGENYPDYLRKHVFAVAMMANSDPNNIPHASAELVTPYTKVNEGGSSPVWHEAEHDIGSPAGGAISTADDLTRFAAALRDGKLVSHATFEEMIKPNSRAPSAYGYGYGMEVGDMYGRAVVGHSGGFPGVSTHLYLLADSPYTVVVLANQDPPSADYVGSKIAALIAEKAKLGK